MKSISILIICSFLFCSFQSNAQRRSVGTSFNLEFPTDKENLSPPDVILGLFYQFPMGKKVALSTTFSFGKKRYYSREKSTTTSGNEILTITQYHESSISLEQMLKIYFWKNPNKYKCKPYGALGYSLRSPMTQKGEKKVALSDAKVRINNTSLEGQKKINLAVGFDFFLDDKIYLSFETGLQSPLWIGENQRLPILVGSDNLYFNFKCGVHLFPILHIRNTKTEFIPAEDLKIKN